MIKFQSFLSGSSGNCTYVTDDTTHLLVDCGATGKYITECLSRLGVHPSQISAILVTHEHRDHVSGVGVMSRKYGIPVLATEGTLAGMKNICGLFQPHAETIRAGKEISVGSLSVRAFAIPHDAAEPVGYRFSDDNSTFTIATDLGHISDELTEELSGSDSIIIEANHDAELLRTGPYPYYLKRRIAGDRGHLSNDNCARLCAMLAKTGTRAFWLGHLSQENNVPTLAYETVKEILKQEGITVGSDVGLNVLSRYWLKETI